MSRVNPHQWCPHGMRWHRPCLECEREALRALQLRSARALLARRREGQDFPAIEVSRALRLVGELNSRNF